MADQRRQWTVECVAGDTDLGLLDWLREKLGVGGSTPRHKPPRMEDERGMVDGVFEFYDVDYYAAVPLSNTASMEVVPQTTGNVEITLCDSTFTLSHLDRADLIRALLHDFHYSTERGGPNDDH